MYPNSIYFVPKETQIGISFFKAKVYILFGHMDP